jgi:glycosyltransferase involved in cell wall biosynthesis
MLETDVVHVGPCNLTLPARFGGAIERRMMALAAAQRALYSGEIVVVSAGARSGSRQVDGVTVRYVASRGPRVPRSMMFARAAAREIARLQPRVVHVHNRPEIAWLLRGLAPAVLSCDYHFEPFHRFRALRGISRALWRRCLCSANAIAPVSEYSMHKYATYWDLDLREDNILPNGVDIRQFRPEPRLRHQWRRRFGLEDRVVWLYVGRLCEQKGTDLLIEAFRRTRAVNDRVALMVAGPVAEFGGAERGPLVDQIQSAGGIYLGAVPDRDLAAVYNCSDLFVMPSRELEMFAMAAVEAQACGKPVVASDHGGLRETVPETAGRRFRRGDVAAMTAALAALSEDAGLRWHLAAGAFENALRYSWDTVALRCDEIYRRAGAELAAHATTDYRWDYVL